MEYMEKKIDKLLRRVSSKSRRAARRARRVANDSSSGSEFDDCSPILTPKCDRKVLTNRRSLSKLSSYSKLNNIPSSEKYREEAFLTVFGIHKSHISYFHIWFVISICQLQKALTTIMRQKEKNQLLSSDSEKSDKDSKSPLLHYDRVATVRRQQQFVDHHHSTNGNKSTETFDKYHDTNDQATQYYSAPPLYEKSCESEDADYVSDHSLYSRPRKSINELDMSVDGSLADLSGRESGYLSGIDLMFINRGSPSSGDSPALSPRGFSFGRERASILMRPKLKPSFAERIIPVREAQIHQPESISHVARPLQERKTQEEDEAGIPDYKTTESMLQSCITETKYVTAIFELTTGGIIGLIDDVLSEFNMWFNDQIGLIGAGCEVQWSCPERYRNRSAERRMKEALHWSLRQNNRRILNLKNNTGMRLPLTLVASTTEENCRHNSELDCFQGVYRRFYTSLLKYQHKETGDWHKPYWSIEDVDKYHQEATPNPQQFIFGSQPTQLDTGSLVAVNIIALRVSF
uniref:Ycf15 n=1 Tax=Parascaris univalens TaxID=6257 RepID=A0A915BI35_PARUN